MVRHEDSIHLPITMDEILEIIIKARNSGHISGMDNLRHRHPNIQFDCILRGYIGEHAFSSWLRKNGVEVEKANLFLEEDQVDIDLICNGKSIELKTSLIPDADQTIEKAIAHRDIKLIKREETIAQLNSEVHIQLIFNQIRKKKDEWLKKREATWEKWSEEELYKHFACHRYLHDIYLVGWIDKKTLVQRLSALDIKEATWTFKGSKRRFWNCPISDAKLPLELPGFLKSG